MARSCTTTAYGWLSLDSPPSLKTLWSAVIKSPNFSARSRVSPMRLLQEDFVIRFSSKRRNFLQIRSFGKWVLMMCFLDSDTTFVGVQNLSPEKCVRVFALMWPLDYLWNPLTRLEDLPTDRPHPSCHPSGIPDPISWWLIRHFAQKNEPEDELDAAQFPETKVHPIPTIPVVAK